MDAVPDVGGDIYLAARITTPPPGFVPPAPPVKNEGPPLAVIEYPSIA